MLTENPIQYLYKFCVKHYVRYYDLQVELVDHLANATEEKMQQNPKLSFEEALNEVYKKFGISGFSRIVSEREIALQKRYRNEFLKSFASYFTIPRIAVTCLIFCLLNVPVFLLKIQNISRLFILYCIAAGIIGLASFIYAVIKYKKPKKSLLLLHSSGGVFGLFALLFQFPNFYFNMFLGGEKINTNQLFSINQVLLVTGIFTVISLLFIAYFQTFKNLYDKAKRDYPFAFENK